MIGEHFVFASFLTERLQKSDNAQKIRSPLILYQILVWIWSHNFGTTKTQHCTAQAAKESRHAQMIVVVFFVRQRKQLTGYMTTACIRG